jgi:hypothetical protein
MLYSRLRAQRAARAVALVRVPGPVVDLDGKYPVARKGDLVEVSLPAPAEPPAAAPAAPGRKAR